MTPRSIVGTPRLFQNNPPINLHRLDSVRFFPINGNLGWLAFPNIIFLWEFGVYLYFLFIDILSLFFVFYIQGKLSAIKSNQQICDYKWVVFEKQRDC